MKTSPSVSVTRPTETRMCCANTWTRLTCTFSMPTTVLSTKGHTNSGYALNPAQGAPSSQAAPRHLPRGGSRKRLRQNPGEGHQLHRPLTNLHTASQLGHSLRSGRARPQLHGRQANHRARQQQVPGATRSTYSARTST